MAAGFRHLRIFESKDGKRLFPEAAAVWISDGEDIYGVLLGFDGTTTTQALRQAPNIYRKKCEDETNGVFRVLRHEMMPTTKRGIGRFSGTCINSNDSKHYEILFIQEANGIKVIAHSSNLAAKNSVIGVTDNLAILFDF